MNNQSNVVFYINKTSDTIFELGSKETFLKTAERPLKQKDALLFRLLR